MTTLPRNCPQLLLAWRSRRRWHFTYHNLQACDLARTDPEQVVTAHGHGEGRRNAGPLRSHRITLDLHLVQMKLQVGERLLPRLPEAVADGRLSGVSLDLPPKRLDEDRVLVEEGHHRLFARRPHLHGL